jgi:hypothetical protein
VKLNCVEHCALHLTLTQEEIDMKLFEATVRRPDGSEFKDRVGAKDATEARMLLQQRHGPRAVPFIPKMIPG